ncbi:MAG: peptidoglycan DD-metalloendopeptidase family protein [Holosporaceae bacterium]|jgi:septal ring factor EnvC (AmiA/AmiB activator)|nr:peptidoglycan DD-metalloendopeptidase family protein [Holosporaceae bacterium]
MNDFTARILAILALQALFYFSGVCDPPTAKKISSNQSQGMKNFCKKAVELEQKIAKIEIKIDAVNQKEKISAPIVKNMYEMLTRCFTVLFDIQRFSKILAMNHQDNKNDFVRCSIIIKNFVSYFKSIGKQLGKTSSEMVLLKNEKKSLREESKNAVSEYEDLLKKIEDQSTMIAKKREENIIQNDVVYHIASKSESIEELDAELEAENIIGVLRNTKISTDLMLSYPVYGKVITEFGDKNPNNQMIYYLSFETRPGAVVISPAYGLIVFAGKFLNYGNMVIISNGEYRIFVYGIDQLFASTGDIVEIGDYMGKMNSNPLSNPVLKMELKKSGEPLDPRQWMLQPPEKGNK